MYQALYRKYRPTTFDDVVGQEIIVQTLKNAIKNNTLTHAYLFAGPRGTGKTSTAKILAKTINCQNLNELEPCNKCDSCTQINNKQTTDIIEIDAASNNGVDEIRELKSKANLVPANSKYKVYIIDEVHMLSTGAFNALLKTLEEPPAHIIFILATTEPHKIPATILSRCQRFDFKKIGVLKIVENLKKIADSEHVIIEEDALREIAVLSQGGMRDSIGLLDQAISYCSNNITCTDIHDINGTIGNEEMNQILRQLDSKNITELLKMFDEFDERGKNLIKLIEEFTYYLRNLLIFQIAPDYFDETEQKRYSELNFEIDRNKLLSYMKQFSKTIYGMKNSDNEKITLELSLIELSNLPIDESFKNCFLPEKNENKKEASVNEEQKNVNVQDTQTDEISKEKEEKKETNQNDELINKIKTIRIDNTLCYFNKKLLFDYKNKIENVKQYLFEETYSQWVSLILDGELKAVGKNYLIFVYKDEPMEYLFNQNWIVIEQILNKVYEEPVRVVATNIKAWNEIKEQFNTKSRTFEWKEEPSFDLPEEKEPEKNEIERIFQDIIEYSE